MRRIPRSVLADRLEHLERAGLVRRSEGPQGNEYDPTDAARALEGIVMGLGLWSRRWAHREIHDDELDPTLLLWDMQRRIDADAAPASLVVVRFDFRDSQRGFVRYWLKIDKGRGEVCVKNPGLDESLVVETTARTLIEVWMGHRTFSAVIRAGDVTVEGPRELARAFPTWFRLNVFTELDREKPGRANARASARH
jgi:hypothetical protein